MSKTKTHQYQSALAKYCTTGTLTEDIPGINTKHIHHYRRLVVNNVYDSVSSAYPLTVNYLGTTKFDEVFHVFFSTEPLMDPQIWMMPKEFMVYIQNKRADLLEEYPALDHLLLFEWLEIEVYMMKDISFPETSVSDVYILNPEIRLVKLDFPVHLKPTLQITEADRGNYFVSLHRHPESGNVHFTNLSIPFVDVLEHLQAHALSKEEICTVLSKYGSEQEIDKALTPFLKNGLESCLVKLK